METKLHTSSSQHEGYNPLLLDRAKRLKDHCARQYNYVPECKTVCEAIETEPNSFSLSVDALGGITNQLDFLHLIAAPREGRFPLDQQELGRDQCSPQSRTPSHSFESS